MYAGLIFACINKSLPLCMSTQLSSLKLKAKDSRFPSLTWLAAYVLLLGLALKKFSVGSMVAFSDIRNIFSDFWDSVYYACQFTGYSYFRILYPPVSSLLLKGAGVAISQCRELIDSRGWTLLAYGAIGLSLILPIYLVVFNAYASRFAPSLNYLSRLELASLSLLVPPTLIGFTRMNTSILLVPAAMLMFYFSLKKYRLSIYISLALLPFIKPMFALIGVLFLALVHSFGISLAASIVYATIYLSVNAFAYHLGGYAGGFGVWLNNIVSFRSSQLSNWRFEYYSYSPASMSYIYSNPFLPSAHNGSPNASLYWLAILFLSLLAICIYAYVGIHIFKSGRYLSRLSRHSMRRQSIALVYAFLLSAYIYTIFSTSLGPYVLCLVTPLVAFMSLHANASRYRRICILLVSCSLLPYIPLDVSVWSPKFPTIICFSLLLIQISQDVRNLSIE